METKPAEIRIQLSLFGDRIELSTYNKIVRQVQVLLEEEERSITGKSPHASWVLDTSAVIPVSAAPNGTSEEDLRQIVREARNDFARALTLGPEQDGESTGSPRSRAAIQRILSQLGEEIQSIVLTGDDVEEITIERSDVAGIHSSFTDVSRNPLTFSPGQHYEDVATLEGVIDLISIQGRIPRFSIRERWSGRHISATFDEPLMESVTKALGRHVEVTGLVRFRGANDPVSIRAVSRILWTDDEPADILTFEGILPDLTNGMDAGDYVRELRSGNLDE